MAFSPLRVSFYLATSTALGAGAAAIAGHGLSRPVSAALLAGYAGLVALGVMSPRSRIFADVIDRVPEGIALTFDDGPHPEHTPRVLDLLDAHDAKATFFMIGRKMKAHPRVVEDVLKRGHAVGAHGFEHDRLFALRSYAWLEQDADREERVWHRIVGALPALFRPPIGLVNPRIARVAAERGRALVAWSFRARDGLASARADKVSERVVRRLKRGVVVLLHDSPERDGDRRVPAAIGALPAILDAAARLGLSPRTLPEPAALPAREAPAERDDS